MFETAKWIRGSSSLPSYCFRKEISLETEAKATISVSAIGFYELFLNGKRINKDVFSPGWTDYKFRTQYQTYSLDLKKNNLLEIYLAEGFAGGDDFAWTRKGAFNYFEKALIFDLEINGQHIVSEEGIDVFSSEILKTSIYYGEEQNELLPTEPLGKSVEAIDVTTKLIPQLGEPIIYGERIEAKSMFKTPKGELVIDFGQNFAGIIELHIQGKRGDVISFQPSEVLDKDGNFYNDNYRKCKSSCFRYTLTGEDKIYRPHFTYLGGRYIKLVEYPEYIQKENFTAVLVHSDIKRTCHFETGHPLLNRLYQNIIYGQLSNYLDVPTDCPQRDERLGWTADTQVFSKTAAINFNVQRFFDKWLGDLRLGQGEEGEVPPIAPRFYWGDTLISSGWGDACTVVPIEMYRAYGDKKVLEENFEMMEKWITYLEKHQIKENIIQLDFSFGDWLGLDQGDPKELQGLTRYDLISTAYYIFGLETLRKSAEILGKNHSIYENKIVSAKESFQKEFIQNSHMKGEKALMYVTMNERTAYTQTGIVLTLYFHLCKEEDRASLAKDLVDLIEECGGKMTTGFIGTPYILYALSENGYPEIAYDTLLYEEFPSWLYSVKKGATTIWEHFDGIKEDGSFWSDNMNSYNHYAYGAVFAWMFENIAGIRNLKASYEEVEIAPIVDERLGHANCTFTTKFGEIISSWSIEKGIAHYNIIVPKGISGKIILPNSAPLSFNDGITFRS